MYSQHYLSPLFDPTAVLLIIDDESPPAWAEPLMAASIDGPEAALRERHSESRPTPIRLCHPRTLAGRKAVPQLLDGIDLVVVATEADDVLPVLSALQGLRAQAAAGAGSKRSEAQLLLLTPAPDVRQQLQWAMQAREAGWRMLGPSSAGFVRPHRGLNLGMMGLLPPAGEIALVTQSGAIGAAMLDWAHEGGTGFSLVASLGDEADIDLAQVLDFVAADRRTRSVIVYLESVHSARRFLSALRALSLVKPVIVLKGGRVGSAVPTLSQADSIETRLYETVLRRAGAVQLRIFAQVEICARYLAARSIPIGPRLGIVSNGRGPLVLAVDEAILNRISVPAIEGAQANPVLLPSTAQPAQIVEALRALGESNELDALLLVIAPYRSLDAEELTRALVQQARRIGLPVFAALLGSDQVRDQAHALELQGIPVFATPEGAVNAYANVARYHANQKLLLQMPRPLSGLDSPALDAARHVIERCLTEAGATSSRRLPPADAKALLEAFHVPVVEPQTANSAEEAEWLADTIGYPVALKVLSPDVPVKSAVGGVRLHLLNGAQVKGAYHGILRAVRAAMPEARIDGVTVQAMRGTSGAIELHVGVYRDTLWGPVISFGVGGVVIGRLRADSSLELPPLNHFLARKIIERARVYGRLSRHLTEAGRFDAGMEAIERVLLRVSEMACELPQVTEIELNPLIIDANGVAVVDARIEVAPAPPVGEHYSHMAIMPYPTYLEQCLSTRSGRVCTIRPIQPEDAEALQAMVRRLSPQARYFRFVSTLSELPPRLLLRFTQIDYDREVALIAVVDGDGPCARLDEAAAASERSASGALTQAGDTTISTRDASMSTTTAPTSTNEATASDTAQPAERIVGVGRYMLNPDGETCEFAIAIDDDWQGQGLGGHLMNSLVSIAERRGLKRIEGHVLGTNYPMLKLMRHLGFKIGAEPDEPEMRLVWRDLPVTDPAG